MREMRGIVGVRYRHADDQECPRSFGFGKAACTLPELKARAGMLGDVDKRQLLIRLRVLMEVESAHGGDRCCVCSPGRRG